MDELKKNKGCFFFYFISIFSDKHQILIKMVLTCWKVITI